MAEIAANHPEGRVTIVRRTLGGGHEARVGPRGLGMSVAGPPRERSRRRFVAVVVVLAIFAVALPVVWWLATVQQKPSQPSRSGCSEVHIFTGNKQSPYWPFATALQRQLSDHLGKTTVLPRETQGGAENLYDLEGYARCGVAIAKLNVAVDAAYGVNQFSSDSAEDASSSIPPHQIKGLRTIGPVFDDLMQIVVRDKPNRPDRPHITDVHQLCGRPLGTGLALSGSIQLTQVFYREICKDQELDLRKVKKDTLKNGFKYLNSTGPDFVDAVIWVNASPTADIQNEIRDNGARLLPVPASVRSAMNDNWRQIYQDQGSNKFAGQNVILPGMIYKEDYGLKQDIATVGVPNGLVVLNSADPGLVAELARILLADQDSTTPLASLWGENPRHRTLADVESYVTSQVPSLFCYVPLHPEAIKVYQAKFHVPTCGRS